jgi:hypothetical protein
MSIIKLYSKSKSLQVVIALCNDLPADLICPDTRINLRVTKIRHCYTDGTTRLNLHSAVTFASVKPVWKPPLWLQTQRSRVLFPALPNFLSNNGSETGYTQPL